MAIVITRIGEKYAAEVTPPHGGDEPWRSAEPVERSELIAQLRARGCHQADIGDAFYAADPEWLLRTHEIPLEQATLR